MTDTELERIAKDLALEMGYVEHAENEQQMGVVKLITQALKQIRDARLKGPSEVNEKTSDGYHTFEELYEHRCLLFISLALKEPSKSYWRPHYEGWPLIGLETSSGQISYHVKESFLPLFKDRIKQGGPEFDGHSSSDVLNRLRSQLRLEPAPEPQKMNIKDEVGSMVKRNNCGDCGNPWWVEYPNSWVCSMCRKTHAKSSSELARLEPAETKARVSDATIERAGEIIMGEILRLKKAKAQRTFYESYDIDNEYDVKITTELMPKKSQKQLGDEMFGIKGDE